MTANVSPYLYTGAWQLCDCKSGSCFGMVSGAVNLTGSTAIRLFFDTSKTHVHDSEDDFIIELPEAFARVLADEIDATFDRCDYLYKLFKDRRLASNAIYSDVDEILEATSDHRDAGGNLMAARLGRDLETERRLIYAGDDRIDTGSVSAYGPRRGGGHVEIRFSKKAVSILTDEGNSLDIKISRRLAEQLSQSVRAAAVELCLLRSLARDERVAM